MTLFYSRQDLFDNTIARSMLRALRLAVSRAGAAFTCIHRAIVSAKTRRMQRELMFYAGSWDDGFVEPDASRDSSGDAARFPQRPLILGDKWDF